MNSSVNIILDENRKLVCLLSQACTSSEVYRLKLCLVSQLRTNNFLSQDTVVISLNTSLLSHPTELHGGGVSVAYFTWLIRNSLRCVFSWVRIGCALLCVYSDEVSHCFLFPSKSLHLRGSNDEKTKMPSTDFKWPTGREIAALNINSFTLMCCC